MLNVDDGRTNVRTDERTNVRKLACLCLPVKAGATKRWEDNIKEWTGMDFASSTRTAENRTRWKGIVANSSVVPRRPSMVMG